MLAATTATTGWLTASTCGLSPRLPPHPAPAPATTSGAAPAIHHQALRALGNRLVGILHGCLEHHTAYDETTAWAHRAENKIPAAA